MVFQFTTSYCVTSKYSFLSVSIVDVEDEFWGIVTITIVDKIFYQGENKRFLKTLNVVARQKPD